MSKKVINDIKPKTLLGIPVVYKGPSTDTDYRKIKFGNFKETIPVKVRADKLGVSGYDLTDRDPADWNIAKINAVRLD